MPDQPRRLPSLSALRAFEALGRNLSFTRAAEELGVTQAAVSRQIRRLEEDLGQLLVIRLPRELQLTDGGERLFRSLLRSFDQIADTVAEISAQGGRQVLTVSVAPYFSSRWLTPRLYSFWSRNPEIDLRLQHAYHPANYLREQVDIGINWGTGNWPGVEAELVLTGELTPVCSPAFLAATPRLTTPADLLGQRLLYEFDVGDWRGWFRAAGVEATAAFASIRLDDSHSLHRAALDGHGVALFFRGLIQEDLETGRLVQPFPILSDPGCAYYLNYPRDMVVKPKVKAFRRWLLEEVARRPYS